MSQTCCEDSVHICSNQTTEGGVVLNRGLFPRIASRGFRGSRGYGGSRGFRGSRGFL